MASAPDDITILLAEMERGNETVRGRLVELLYVELRRLAGNFMHSERSDHTLQPTALVHEAYLRLLGDQELQFKSRAHFLAIAVTAMRRILVEYARRKNGARRAAPPALVQLSEPMSPGQSVVVEVLDLDRALRRLAGLDARLSQIVELRYFGGLTVEEIAETLDLSTKTVNRDWSIAKAWLRGHLNDADDDTGRVDAN